MIAFISDVHGNYPALRAVLDAIDQMGCQKIICLGDICGYYCQINECMTLLRESKVHCLQGNHDHYLITSQCCNSKTVKMCIDFQQKIIMPSHLQWLKTLVPYYDSSRMSLRHAGWNDALEERFRDFSFTQEDLPSVQYFFSGHTHIQSVQREEASGKIYCNPGAVGQPRDGNPQAGFAVLHEDGHVSLHRVAYDIDAVAEAMQKAGLGDWIWKCLYQGKQIGAK